MVRRTDGWAGSLVGGVERVMWVGAVRASEEVGGGDGGGEEVGCSCLMSGCSAGWMESGDVCCCCCWDGVVSELLGEEVGMRVRRRPYCGSGTFLVEVPLRDGERGVSWCWLGCAEESSEEFMVGMTVKRMFVGWLNRCSM